MNIGTNKTTLDDGDTHLIMQIIESFKTTTFEITKVGRFADSYTILIDRYGRGIVLCLMLTYTLVKCTYGFVIRAEWMEGLV